MRFPISFRAAAEAEFDDAFDFYEKRQPELGVEFLAEVQSELDKIAENPLMHQVVFADIRMGVVRRFPFTILSASSAANRSDRHLSHQPRSRDLARKSL